MIMSVFPNKYVTQAYLEDINLWEMVTNPVISHMKKDKLITSSLFKDNDRSSGSEVTKTQALWLDFDNTDKFFYVCEIIDKLGINFVAYTTFSHTQEQNRFRVIIPADGLNPLNYTPFSSYFCLLNKLNPDTTSRQAGRIYYPPIHKPKAEYLYVEAGNKNNLLVTGSFNNSVTKASTQPKPMDNLSVRTLELACLHLSRLTTERNNTLYNNAFKYFLTDIPKPLIIKLLTEAAEAAGLRRSEISATINSALNKLKSTRSNRHSLDNLFK